LLWGWLLPGIRFFGLCIRFFLLRGIATVPPFLLLLPLCLLRLLKFI
jgi:hypothetical protein